MQQYTPDAIHQWLKQNIKADIPAKRALQQLTRELRSWSYDLHVKLDSHTPLASFLKLKRGHCELFATTLALAARDLGIPSRIINGYYGGEWNKTGNFLILRQQHAHSWVEVWLDQRWQRIDPTPASRWQLSGVRFPQWDEWWETIKLSWYRYVLEFQSDDKKALFKAMLAGAKAAWPWLLAGLITSIVGRQAWAYRQRRRSNIYRLSRQQRIVDKWLKKHAIIRPAHVPLRQLATPQGIADKAWQQWLTAWEKQAYGRDTTWTARQLKRHLRALCRIRC